MAAEAVPEGDESRRVCAARDRVGRPSRVAGRRIGVAFLVAAGVVVAILGSSVDTSPLARLPDSLAVARGVSYGPGKHHTLDVAYERARSRPRPAIVMIHPGGWMRGDKSAYHALMAEYAQRGYATVSINFRPSGAARFPAALQDCKRAVRWLRVHAADYGVDPGRIGVTGWSSGAHLAMLVALTDDDFEKGGESPGVSSRVQAAVCVSGVYDFLLQNGGRFPNAQDDEAVVRFLGSTPSQDPGTARRASPLHHLSEDDPPVLVFHGELDRRIDVEQARHFARASRALGREDEGVVLPGEGHGRDVLPRDPESRRTVVRFFARHLRPEGSASRDARTR